jgi:hypothetical protein
MWIFLRSGFYSVTLVPGLDDVVQVRARAREHLEALRAKHPGLGAVSVGADEGFAHADYPFRLFVPRRLWARVMHLEAAAIDYPNFKAVVRDLKFHDVLFAVWDLLQRVYASDRPPAVPLPAAKKKARPAHPRQRARR